MTWVTRTQPHRNGRHAKPEPSATAPSLPLSPQDSAQPDQTSLGDLVREATTHFSTLIRSEVELAKAELAAEARKGVKGSILFIVAFSILLFSLFFFFIALGEVLDIWLARWAAFSIVFGLMVVAAAAAALIGWRRVRSIRKPERTISSVRDTGVVLTQLRSSHQHGYHQLGEGQQGAGHPGVGQRGDGRPVDPPFADPQFGDPHHADRHGA